jgi:Trypsin Inhibitor like cysteine rich domain
MVNFQSNIFAAQDYVIKLNVCAANEVFNDCGKPDYCDGTCNNPNALGVKCPEVCVKRCECKPGFVRALYNSNMTCVPVDSCPKPQNNLAGFCTFTDSLKGHCPKHAECPKGYQLRRKDHGCCCEEFTIRKILSYTKY